MLFSRKVRHSVGERLIHVLLQAIEQNLSQSAYKKKISEQVREINQDNVNCKMLLLSSVVALFHLLLI